MNTHNTNTFPKHITILDRSFRIIDTNSHLDSIFDISSQDAKGKNFFELLPSLREKGLHSEMQQTLLTGVTCSGEMEVTSMDGRRLYLAYECLPNVENSRIKGVIFRAEDVNKKKQKERQLAIQEKMSNLGTLAASIGHEINNPLEAILNRVGCLLMEDFHEGGVARLRKELELIQEQVYRISSTTNALIAFSKESSEHFRPVNINSIVEKSVELCRLYHAKPGIKIDVDLAADLPKVFGSEIGLEQCIVNIINNSLEATKGDGIIKVETCRDHSNDKIVMVMITDQGEGIPEENLNKIFDPFFSTKDTVYGSGLGLSISYGIIADHDGIIEVNSEVGKGTTVMISIPMIDGERCKQRE